MSDRTYAISEFVGTSPDSIEKAIDNGLSRASQTTRNMNWFEVTEIRGQIEDGKVNHYQVSLKLGFRLEDV